MKTNIEIHPTQARIIASLLFSSGSRFSKLNVDNIPTDQFSFHIKALLLSGLVVKDRGQVYKLTDLGKEFANRFDTQKVVFEKQAKFCVVIHCEKIENGIKKYLLHERQKHPYFGYVGPCGGKVKLGETAQEAAVREFAEETGIIAKVVPLLVKHKMDYSPEGKLIEDKFFVVFKAVDISGDLLEQVEGGRNAWYTLDQIAKLPLVFDDFDRTMSVINQTEITFTEKKYKVSGF